MSFFAGGSRGNVAVSGPVAVRPSESHQRPVREVGLPDCLKYLFIIFLSTLDIKIKRCDDEIVILTLRIRSAPKDQTQVNNLAKISLSSLFQQIWNVLEFIIPIIAKYQLNIVCQP